MVNNIEGVCAIKPHPDLWGRSTQYPFHEEQLLSVRFCSEMETCSCRFDPPADQNRQLNY